MRNLLVFALAAFALPALALPAQGTRHFVDAAVAASGDGRTWGTAFKTVQEALAVAASGNHVWVAAGTYSGGFTVPAGVVLLGGFRAGDLRSTQRAPVAQPAVLDGEDRQRVLVVADGSVVDGFTITRGNAPAPGGGGVLVDGVDPVIRNCRFVANRNSGGRGSAMAVYGGGAPRVENCVFTRSNGVGHVIDVNSSGGTYRNLVVADNVSNGLHFQAGSAPRIENCAFVDNTGFGLCHIDTSDRPTLHHCLLQGNRNGHILVPGGAVRTIEGVNALAYARGNVTGDPLFSNAPGLDYRITAASPMVDAGTGTLHDDAPEDQFGGARVLDGTLDGTATIDIGVHEVGHVALSVPRHADRGAIFALALTGRPGLLGGVLLGAGAASVWSPPLGHFRLSPAAPFVAVVLGPLPVQTSFVVPSSLPIGAPLYWQGFALGANGGNLTGLADVVVR